MEAHFSLNRIYFSMDHSLKFFYVVALASLFITSSIPISAQLNTSSQDSLSAVHKSLAGKDSLAILYHERRATTLNSMVNQLLKSGASLNFIRDKGAGTGGGLSLADSIRTITADLSDYVQNGLQEKGLGDLNYLDLGKLARAIGNLFGKDGSKRKSITSMPLPTLLELDVLTLLWRNKKSNSQQLYAALDSLTSIKITARMFWQALHDMAQKGFVSEKIISPQLLLTVGIGPFSTPVEMSSKNRKNRVWEYESLISEEELIPYIHAKNYLARLDNRGAGRKADKEEIQTEKLLYRLFEKKKDQDAANE